MPEEERSAGAAALPGEVHADDDLATAARGEESCPAHRVVDVGGDTVEPAPLVGAEPTAGAEAEAAGSFDFFDFIMPRAENLRPTPPVWGESAPAPAKPRPTPRLGSAAESSLPRWVAVTIVTCAISCLTCAIACIVVATAFVSRHRDASGGVIRDAPPPAAASPAVPSRGATVDAPLASSEADAPEVSTARAAAPTSPRSPLPRPVTGSKWPRPSSTAPSKPPRPALPHGTLLLTLPRGRVGRALAPQMPTRAPK